MRRLLARSQHARREPRARVEWPATATESGALFVELEAFGDRTEQQRGAVRAKQARRVTHDHLRP